MIYLFNNATRVIHPTLGKSSLNTTPNSRYQAEIAAHTKSVQLYVPAMWNNTYDICLLKRNKKDKRINQPISKQVTP